MLHQLTVDGQSHQLSLTQRDSGTHVEINGKSLRVLSFSKEHILLEDGRVLPCSVSPTATAGLWRVHLQGSWMSVQQAQRRRAGAQAHTGGLVNSPMNGVVVKVVREVGSIVAVEEVVLVLEAMKMENEVTAPLAGKLKTLSVQAGQTVAAGEKLFEIEEEVPS